MKKLTLEALAEKGLRFFYYGTMIPVTILMFYFAGWVWGGVSGMVLSWVINYVSGRDYSQQFTLVFPIAGKIIGTVTGILAARYMFKR